MAVAAVIPAAAMLGAAGTSGTTAGVSSHVAARTSSRRTVKVPQRLIDDDNQQSEGESDTSTRTNRTNGGRAAKVVAAKTRLTGGSENETNARTKRANSDVNKRKRSSSSDDEAPKSRLRVSFDDKNAKANASSRGVRTPKKKKSTAKPLESCGLELLLRASESLDKEESDDMVVSPRQQSRSMAPVIGVANMGWNPAIYGYPSFAAQCPTLAPPSFIGAPNANQSRVVTSHTATTTAAVSADAGVNTPQSEALKSATAAVAKSGTKAATATAEGWLDTLIFDVKGRLAALQRSQHRIQRVKAMYRKRQKPEDPGAMAAPAGQDAELEDVAMEVAGVNANGALHKKEPGHCPVALSLFWDMELALIHENEKLQKYLKEIEDMKSLCLPDEYNSKATAAASGDDADASVAGALTGAAETAPSPPPPPTTSPSAMSLRTEKGFQPNHESTAAAIITTAVTLPRAQ